MRYDEDLWPQIEPHRWKWQSGRVDIVGAILHCTRSGIPNRRSEVELSSCKNWFISPDNAVRDAAGNKWFSGMSSDIVGGGRLVRAVPHELVPRFSAGTHDFWAVSIEVCQGVRSDPIDPRDIEVLAEHLTDLAGEFEFPLTRLAFVDGSNIGWPGLVGHEDTAQGRQQGKSDPGPNLWEPLMAALDLREEDMGITEERLQAILDERDRQREQAEIEALGSTQLRATAALVKRQRAMGRAATLEEVIAANDPRRIPE